MFIITKIYAVWGQMWYHVLVIPATSEVEIEGLWFNASPRLKIGEIPAQK
jgi:hypothetical protein